MMESLSEGKDEDLRSPLFKGQSDEEILAGWHQATKGLEDLVPRLAEMEESEEGKFGSRSISVEWDAFKGSVYDYFRDEGGRDDLPVFTPTRRVSRLIPKSPDLTVKSMVLNTASGLPFLDKKKLVLNETLADLAYLLEQGYPAILWIRTQEGKKTRPIWIWPMADTIREQSYYQVLLREVRQWEFRAALLGPDAVDKAVTRLFYNRQGTEKLLSIDFARYDASLQPRILLPALQGLLGMFQDTEELKDVIDRVLYISLVTPDGVVHGAHGMSSGSSLTNEGDSYAQFMMAVAAFRDVHPGLQDLQSVWDYVSGICQIQGDDGLYLVDDPEWLTQQFEAFGMEVNRDKSETSEEYALYLRRLYHPSYRHGRYLRGVYSTTRALNRVVHLERWPDPVVSKLTGDELSGDDYFSIRTIAILENSKWHPWHPELVRYVASNDKHQLRFSLTGLHLFSEAAKKGGGVAGRTHQYSDTVTASGIGSFETVKVLQRSVW
jgi:hypothetical protein